MSIRGTAIEAVSDDPEVPNEEKLERFEERMREAFAYDKLREWPLEAVHAARHEFELAVLKFKTRFPPDKSLMQGPTRQGALDNPARNEVTLTVEERARLDQLRREVCNNIKRAIAEKKRERTDRRLKYLDKIEEIVDISISLPF